ncbi:uncharacterized protein LOC141898375 isoform X2 [Tubulanus polymorphus]|uniref:uncharacterized protein LOC141898375 isoform X2 n=1 Tax=Tubulanus polymorphus TaxID=672921 RepID=UPI003DA51766
MILVFTEFIAVKYNRPRRDYIVQYSIMPVTTGNKHSAEIMGPKLTNRSTGNMIKKKSCSCFTFLSRSRLNSDDEYGEDGIIGVLLTNETITDSNGLSLGFVFAKSRTISVAAFRDILKSQLFTLPETFTFRTKEGWPILLHQENNLKLKHILTKENAVRIQRAYEKPRVGIKMQSGSALGFVFVYSTSSLNVLREEIKEQLGHISDSAKSNYQFLDCNGWPISEDQENQMAVLDILNEASVRICGEVFSNEITTDDCNSAGSPGSTANLYSAIMPSLSAPATPVLTPKQRKVSTPSRQRTYRSSKDSERTIQCLPSSTNRSHQILISYVRAEAAQYAQDLKRCLTELGFTVYLDIHEIKTGIDWQDALNDAVSNCELFVPLVTQSYGETQWTNREVKLADVLNKVIVPVNFGDVWPPKCLAIQFATTQFIKWSNDQRNRSIKAQNHTGCSQDVNSNEETHKVVSRELAERYKQYVKAGKKHTSLKKQPSYVRYSWVSSPAYANTEPPMRPLVVVSVHPEQKEFGQRLKVLFEAKGYDVWCSTEMLDADTEMDSQEPLFSQDTRETQLSDDNDIPLSPISQESTCSIGTQNRLQLFQQRADEAGAVVFVLSRAFAASKTSKQQVFYCEHRKRVVPLKYEEFCMPGWMSMLIGTSTLENCRYEGYEDSLVCRVARALDPTGGDMVSEEVNEAKITKAVSLLKKAVNPEGCIYISGGTRFYYPQSEAICKAIGENLAKLDNVSIVTGGFYGIGDVVGQSFFDARQKEKKTPATWHVLPVRDEKDCTERARQNRDKTFQIVPYGSTAFSGDSVRERETIVSRVFEICILIEGGPGAAHEAEQFIWSDHNVIPIRVTGGAAGGKFNVPEKIFEVPGGVSAEDWTVLSDKKATPEKIGQVVARIVQSLQLTLKLYRDNLNQTRKRKLGLSRRPQRVSSIKTFILPNTIS